MKVGDRVKVVSNDEMNTRGLMGRYGHIEELITPEMGENPICRNCGQRENIHTEIDEPLGRELTQLRVSKVLCFRGSNQHFEPLEKEPVALVQFPDFITHVEVRHLTVQKDQVLDG